MSGKRRRSRSRSRKLAIEGWPHLPLHPQGEGSPPCPYLIQPGAAVPTPGKLVDQGWEEGGAMGEPC